MPTHDRPDAPQAVTGEQRAELRRVALRAQEREPTLAGWPPAPATVVLPPGFALALLDALDAAEAEREQLIGDLLAAVTPGSDTEAAAYAQWTGPWTPP